MILVAALFTEGGGDPAIGLTLGDIEMYLTRRTKADGTVTPLWAGLAPTEEMGGGVYVRAYTGEELGLYDYFSYAYYGGAAVLDTPWSLFSY